MKLIYYFVLFILLSSCGRQFKLSRTETTVDSSYIYSLPYANGKSPLLIQGYNSWFSHKGRLGLDFKLKKGTPIHAARGGVVTSVREEFTGHGLNKKYLRKANHIIIRHNDGSQAMYAHLQKDGGLRKMQFAAAIPAYLKNEYVKPFVHGCLSLSTTTTHKY